jgi:hypothetical protein
MLFSCFLRISNFFCLPPNIRILAAEFVLELTHLPLLCVDLMQTDERDKADAPADENMG